VLLIIDLVGSLKTALYFIVVLSVLVTVHEWGHFIVAKLCGMRVEDFSLFFGKRLIRLGVRNGTEYNIRSFPLGGFVKIAGMEPDDISNGAALLQPGNSSRPGRILSGLNEETLAEIDRDRVGNRVREAVNQAVDADGKLTLEGKAELNSLLIGANANPDEHRYLEAVLAADDYEPDPDSYNSKPLWQRAAVIFAGPFMSILFGYLMFCTLGFTTGLPDQEKVENVVSDVVRDQPADRAGIKAGDRIVAIDGRAIQGGDEMVEVIHNSIGKPLNIQVERAKQTLAFVVTPYGEMGPVMDHGRVVTKRAGHIGIQPKIDLSLRRYTPLTSVRKGTVLIYNGVLSMFANLFSPRVRETVGGPIAIAGQIHEARQAGTVYVLIITASLSISLGIINLFPIPILDGGHLLLLAVEGIRRRRLSTREIYRAQIVGLSVICLLFVFVMYNDIQHLLPHAHPHIKH
jgi:regulator of sigma E protease